MKFTNLAFRQIQLLYAWAIGFMYGVALGPAGLVTIAVLSSCRTHRGWAQGDTVTIEFPELIERSTHLPNVILQSPIHCYCFG